MTSVTKAVSVVCTVTTGGVMVLLALAIGVAIVVVKTVSVLVTEVVAGVCRQEHTRAMSEAGRDMMLEKILA
jgi:ABC-type nickel/cobalt efflux system permease component RcnA